LHASAGWLLLRMLLLLSTTTFDSDIRAQPGLAAVYYHNTRIKKINQQILKYYSYVKFSF
jgi:hypothetical protein